MLLQLNIRLPLQNNQQEKLDFRSQARLLVLDRHRVSFGSSDGGRLHILHTGSPQAGRLLQLQAGSQRKVRQLHLRFERHLLGDCYFPNHHIEGNHQAHLQPLHQIEQLDHF